jgi:ParB family chromosome partitioning protein
MSSNRRAWISRRGQVDADAAIDQVIDHRPQPGEQVQQIADEVIEDSPHQARQSFSDDSVEDLAQGMREAGFQGVLIVRPHSDSNKRQRGIVQLVYGHRRRVAWRQVCDEQGQPSVLPVVVREISDEQMLTIGAQENLQRRDLDPVEEAQIVAWHERLFFDKNQAEIGAMLGKSSDWVSTRSRIHKLPDALKDRLRQRPRAISQILELATLSTQQPDTAVKLADRVVHEHLTLDAVRSLTRGYLRPEPSPTVNRENEHNHRGAATLVPDITNSASSGLITPIPQAQSDRLTIPPDDSIISIPSASQSPLATPDQGMTAAVDSRFTVNPPNVLALLQEAVTVLSDIASRAHLLKPNADIDRLVHAAANSVENLGADRLRRALHGHPHQDNHIYRLAGTEIDAVLVMLFSRHPVAIRLQSAHTEGISLRLVVCLLASDGTAVRAPQSTPELFIAVAGAGNATTPANAEVSTEWARQRLKLQHRPAALVAALLNDLAKGTQYLQRGRR